MRRLGLWLLPMLAVLFGGGSAVATEQIYDRAGRWTIWHQMDEETRSFTGCHTLAGTRDAWLGFGIDAEGYLEVWLHNANWRLTPDQTYEVGYQIDGLRRREGTLAVSGESTAYFQVSVAEQLFKELRRGNQLRVFAEQTVLRFSLKGTAKALTSLRDCWETYETAGEAGRANPFGEGQAVEERRQAAPRKKQTDAYARRRASDPDFGIHAVRETVRLMSEYGFKPRHDYEAAASTGIKYSWFGPAVVGYVTWVRRPMTMQDVRNQLKVAGQICRSVPQTSVTRRASPQGGMMVSKDTCISRGDGIELHTVSAYYPWQRGTLIIAHAASELVDGENAEKAFHVILPKILYGPNE